MRERFDGLHPSLLFTPEPLSSESLRAEAEGRREDVAVSERERLSRITGAAGSSESEASASARCPSWYEVRVVRVSRSGLLLVLGREGRWACSEELLRRRRRCQGSLVLVLVWEDVVRDVDGRRGGRVCSSLLSSMELVERRRRAGCVVGWKGDLCEVEEGRLRFCNAPGA